MLYKPTSLLLEVYQKMSWVELLKLINVLLGDTDIEYVISEVLQ
jgi:hypothetical protein